MNLNSKESTLDVETNQQVMTTHKTFGSGNVLGHSSICVIV